MLVAAPMAMDSVCWRQPDGRDSLYIALSRTIGDAFDLLLKNFTQTIRNEQQLYRAQCIAARKGGGKCGARTYALPWWLLSSNSSRDECRSFFFFNHRRVFICYSIYGSILCVCSYIWKYSRRVNVIVYWPSFRFLFFACCPPFYLLYIVRPYIPFFFLFFHSFKKKEFISIWYTTHKRTNHLHKTDLPSLSTVPFFFNGSILRET